jgi:flagellar biosynthetic protein FliQ
MSSAAVISCVREMLTLTLMLLTPFLAVAVLVSLAIGLFQASVRIGDLTLSFIPRFGAVLLVTYLSGSWLTGQLIAYIERSVIAVRAVLG